MRGGGESVCFEYIDRDRATQSQLIHHKSRDKKGKIEKYQMYYMRNPSRAICSVDSLGSGAAAKRVDSLMSKFVVASP